MTNTGRDLVLDGDVKCSLYCNIAQELWKTTIQLHLSLASVYQLFPVMGENTVLQQLVVTVSF